MSGWVGWTREEIIIDPFITQATSRAGVAPHRDGTRKTITSPQGGNYYGVLTNYEDDAEEESCRSQSRVSSID